MIDFDKELELILRIVRYAGAWDDHMGGEDWSHSDKSIGSARKAIKLAIEKHIIGEDVYPTIQDPTSTEVRLDAENHFRFNQRIALWDKEDDK